MDIYVIKTQGFDITTLPKVKLRQEVDGPLPRVKQLEIRSLWTDMPGREWQDN